MTAVSGLALADQLRAAEALPASWAAAIETLPRERFTPDRMWVDEGGDDEIDCAPLDRSAEPDRWLAVVNSDRVIVTQFDDGATRWPNVGYRPTCSSSMPSAMLRMLEALDVHDGHRVLEIGTGTGYNAGLLAARATEVVTIEVDEALAQRARTALRGIPNVRVITADGAAGHRPAAPFDRVLATASVRLGLVPYDWVAQTLPGGVIVVPIRTDLTSGPLVRFTVGDDGTATGRPVPTRVSFMELRAQRAPARWPAFRWDDPAADLTRTELEPWTALLAEAPQWAIAVAIPRCTFEVWEPAPDRPYGVALLVDACSTSWASVVPADADGVYEVRQRGPRRLWDELEAAHRWWRRAGEPQLDDWEFVVAPERQAVGLAQK